MLCECAMQPFVNATELYVSSFSQRDPLLMKFLKVVRMDRVMVLLVNRLTTGLAMNPISLTPIQAQPRIVQVTLF